MTATGGTVVNKFSPYKDQPIHCEKRYTFKEKNYIIHTFSARCNFNAGLNAELFDNHNPHLGNIPRYNRNPGDGSA